MKLLFCGNMSLTEGSLGSRCELVNQIKQKRKRMNGGIGKNTHKLRGGKSEKGHASLPGLVAIFPWITFKTSDCVIHLSVELSQMTVTFNRLIIKSHQSSI